MELFPLPTGMAVLLGISLAMAVVAHWRIKGFWFASAAAAVATVAAFFLVCLVQAGMPSPLSALALAYFTGFGFMVAVVIGMLARATRALVPRRV